MPLVIRVKKLESLIEVLMAQEGGIKASIEEGTPRYLMASAG